MAVASAVLAAGRSLATEVVVAEVVVDEVVVDGDVVADDVVAVLLVPLHATTVMLKGLSISSATSRLVVASRLVIGPVSWMRD